MDVLTADIISVIVTRKFTTIEHNKYTYAVSYIDKKGRYHRINGPAYICGNSRWSYYFHGKYHRADPTKPAECIFGYYEWYNMGKFVAKRKK